MGSLTYLRVGLKNSPYSQLLSESVWEDACKTFIKLVFVFFSNTFTIVYIIFKQLNLNLFISFPTKFNNPNEELQTTSSSKEL